jgi:hypothetical protein
MKPRFCASFCIRVDWCSFVVQVTSTFWMAMTLIVAGVLLGQAKWR